MVKRKIYAGTRDEGWSNGKYWKEKRTVRRETEEYYHAYCTDCNSDTLHEWDMCTVCEFDARRDAGGRRIPPPRDDDDRHIYPRDI